MKVIFLDIHGVLCCARSAAACGGYPAAGNPASWVRFDNTAIALLRTVVACTGANVVLSSNWRDEANLPALEYRLSTKFFDTTRPSSGEADTRGARVADWMTQHPEVDTYAILDDDEDFNPDQARQLCLTSKRNGFLLGDFDQAVELLGVSPS